MHRIAARVDGLVAGYLGKAIVQRVSLAVATGEVVALIGHNGAGKSTLLRAVFGLIPIMEGRVGIWDLITSTPKPAELIRMGVAYVPQRRSVFESLSVAENLEVGVLYGTRNRQDIIGVAVDLFPQLGSLLKKRAGELSGGEKQMVAVARALAGNPRLFLLDEPTLGLASNVAVKVFNLVAARCREGAAALIVEQRIREIVSHSDRVYVLRNGQVSYEGEARPLRDEVRLREVYL